MASGGVAASFGFRYQNLVTVELLLELYESSSTDWVVAVDLNGQDSSDILVYARPGAGPETAVQVKASLPTSDTIMGKPEAETLLAAIADEHPSALERVVRTNRPLTEPARDLRDALRQRPAPTGAITERIDARDEGVREVTDRLINRIGRLRQRGGLGTRLHHILLALLVDMVQQCGSHPSAQTVDRPMVEKIIDGPTATLADAAGRRVWGLTHGAPAPDAVDRPEIFEFLSRALTDEALHRGTPSTAVLAGSPGTGKSVATGLWAARRREHYAFTIWLDATSSGQLSEQAPELLRWLAGDAAAAGAVSDAARARGAEPSAEDLAQSFQDALAVLPVPWLLVFDGATDPAELRPWIPVSGYGHIAITTFRGDWPRDLAPQLFIEAMPDRTATALIRHRLSGPGSCWDEPLDPDAVEFSHRLGRWPLAIDLACSWVRQLGGDISRLPEFTARLDRFHLTEEDGEGLGGYPRAVGVLVSELWNSLSAPARSVLTMVVLSGGSSLPAGLIDDWGQAVSERSPLTITARSAIIELVGVSLLTRRLRGDARSASRYDEIVSVHDGIRLTLEEAGIGVPIGLTYTWLEVCAEALLGAIRTGRFVDAEVLAPPISVFLQHLLVAATDDADDHSPAVPPGLSSDPADPSREAGEQMGGGPEHVSPHRLQREMATTVMHNLGVLDLLIGRFERAEFWLSCAVDVREEPGTRLSRADSPSFAATQIQTLGQLIQAVAHRRAFDRIRPLALRALAYAEDPRVFDVTGIDPPAATVLRTIEMNTFQASEDCTDVRADIARLLDGRDTTHHASNGLAGRVEEFNVAIGQATALAQDEQWSRAVELVLSAAAPSRRDDVLLSESVEAVLEVAIFLLHSLLRRSPDALADSWWPAFRSLAQWCESVEIDDQRQRTKASFLGPIAKLDGEMLGRAITDTEADVVDDQQLEAWRQSAILVREWLDRPSSGILSGMGTMPPGMEVLRRVSVSEEILSRPVFHEGRPGLVVHMPGLLVRTADGDADFVRHTLLTHGFPEELDSSGTAQIAKGWSLRFYGEGRCALSDPRGDEHFEFAVSEDNSAYSQGNAWRNAVEQTGWVSVICRDPADVDPAEVFATPVQGLVRVIGREEGRSRDTGLKALLGRLRSYLGSI